MPTKKNLLGLRFGKLTVIAESGRDGHGAVMWDCQCECGAHTRVRGTHLTQGVTASCGCGIGVATAERETTHGQSKSPLYIRWRAMRNRCENPRAREYGNYGGRGIRVCERWLSFENFAADMGATFDARLELERRDVNGNYGPGNCVWASRTEQQRNRRNNHRVTYVGDERTLVEWAETTGLKPNTILTRLRRGWSVARALGFE